MKVLYINDHDSEMNCFGTEERVLSFLGGWAWYENAESEEDFNVPLKDKIQIENVTMWMEDATEEDIKEYDNITIL